MLMYDLKGSNLTKKLFVQIHYRIVLEAESRKSSLTRLGKFFQARFSAFVPFKGPQLFIHFFCTFFFPAVFCFEIQILFVGAASGYKTSLE